jgi:hypothetical protein
MNSKSTLLLFAVFLIFAAGIGCTGVTGTGSGSNSSTSTLTTASGQNIYVIATTEGNDVATNKAVFAQFGSALDASTVTAANITISPNVAIQVDYDSVNNIAILRPTNQWAADTPYTVTISTGVKTASGDSLAAPFVFTFTTRGTPDVSPPNLLANGVGGCVPAVGPFAARFGEELDSTTVNSSTVSVAGISGTPTYDALTRAILWYPSAPLTAGATYTATVTGGVKDLGGVSAGAGNFVQQFTVWHLNENLNVLLNARFGDVTSNFFMIGLTSGNHIVWDQHGLAALDAFLGQTDTGASVSPPPGGFLSLYNFSGQVNLFSGDTAFAADITALQLNVLFNGFDGTNSTYGHLVVSGTGNPALDGLTVSEVLAIAEQYFASGALPAGISPDEFMALVRNIDLAFQGCTASDWSKTHLALTANLKG